jgi:hypothetical protein
MTKPFDLLALYGRFGREQQVSLKDPTTAQAFLADIRVQLDRALTDPALLHGQRTAAMFEALLLALGRFTLLKVEDTGRVHPSPGFRAPDFRVVLENGEQWLIEVKNVYKRDPRRQSKILMTQDYLAEMNAYAKATKATLKLAVFWARWGIWTLLSPGQLVDSKGRVKVDMGDALRFSELSALGDRVMGTRPPLMLRLAVDETKPNAVGPDGITPFTIAGVTFFCGGQEITRPVEKDIAWFFMNYGDWTEQTPQAVVEDGKLRAIEYIWEPEIKSNASFEFIGTLSRMFSRYYALESLSGPDVMQIEVDGHPGWFASVAANDYKGDVLPLWRLVQQPAFKTLTGDTAGP